MKFFELFLFLTAFTLASEVSYNEGAECPPKDQECKLFDKTFLPTSPNGPQCWIKNEAGWSCSPKISGMDCDASKSQVDVTKCYEPVFPKPTCPQGFDRCRDFSGNWFRPNDTSAPICWSKYNNFYNCGNPKPNEDCNSTLEINIKTCGF